MRSKLLIFVMLLLAVACQAQVPTGAPQLFGGKYYQFGGYVRADSGFLIVGRDTTVRLIMPGIVYRNADSAFYYWNMRRWQRVGAGSGGGGSDPLKLNISDTASMLSPYLRSSTASSVYQPIGSYATTSQLSLKLNISDTASMLAGYQRQGLIGLPSGGSVGQFLSKSGVSTYAWSTPAYPPTLVSDVIGLQDSLNGIRNVSVPTSRTITINGTTFDLTANRSWTVTTGSPTWGSITGTLSSQTDLQTALNSKEPSISSGTTAQYWRGDKSWQTLNTTAVGEGSNLYYTDARARASVSLTTTGSSGSATYNSTTGVLNVPAYTLTGLGGVPTTRTINGFDLSANRTLTTTDIGEGTNLYYTDARARAAHSLTTTGSSGSATYNSTTGAWNIPAYTLTGLGGVPTSRTLTINGTAFDLSADRSWTISAGATSWGTITGTLSSQTDLQTALDAKVTYPSGGSVGQFLSKTGATTSGWATPSYPPTTVGDVTGLQDSLNVLRNASINGLALKENTITAGTTAQYWRGDKSWQTLNTTAVPEGTNLYYTDSRARSSISLTTTGTSGAATYNNTTGALNVPNYTAAGLGAVPTSRTLTINGTSFDLSADRSWSISAGAVAWGGITGTLSSQTDLQTALDAKQDDLISGTNLRTVNGTTLLGSGDVATNTGHFTNQRRSIYSYFNELINTVATSSPGNDVQATNTGTSAATSAQASDATNRIGLVRSTTGSTATGRTAVNSSASAIRLGGGAWTFETFLNVTTLSNATERYQLAVGFFDTYTAANQVDGVYFLYDEGAVSTGSTAAAYWQTVTTSNSVRVFNNGLTQTTVSAATWVKLRIEVNAAATQAQFYINDALVATHTGSIPTGAGRETGFGWLLIKSVGTTARTVDFDYIGVQNVFTSQR